MAASILRICALNCFVNSPEFLNDLLVWSWYYDFLCIPVKKKIGMETYLVFFAFSCRHFSPLTLVESSCVSLRSISVLPTSGGLSVGIVRSRIKATECFICLSCVLRILYDALFCTRICLSSEETRNLTSIWFLFRNPSCNIKVFSFSIVGPSPFKMAPGAFLSVGCSFLSHEAQPHTLSIRPRLVLENKSITNSVASVRERTIPADRPSLVGEVNASFCG
jgi:hypothetical protein